MMVQPLLEQIIPVYNKTIQVNSLTNMLSVEGDNNTSTKVFKIYRYYNRIDLSKLKAWVLLERPDGISYNNLVKTELKEDDFIYIEWTVSSQDCKYPGTVLVSIIMGEYANDNIWQTAPAKFKVIDQIGSEGLIDPSEPNVLNKAIAEMVTIQDDTREMINNMAEDIYKQMEEDAKKYYPAWHTF